MSTPNGLTSKDVMDLYEEWSSDVNSVHTLDYGFTLDGKNLWFSHTIAKWEGEISLSFTEQDSFGNMEKLIIELENKKRSILSII